MRLLRKRSWSPYTVGAAIGAVETFAMLTAKRPLGITSAFEDTAALAAQRVAPQAMDIDEYTRERAEAPGIDWEIGLVAGVVLGSMLSSWLSGDRRSTAVRDTGTPGDITKGAWRYASALGGGALMMFGARMAKGCTSGHGISGTMQFAASSWLFSPIIFATGAIIRRALFGGGR